MKFLMKFLIAISTGFLLFAAWPMSPFTLFIFIAWVPLLVVEKKALKPFYFFLILWGNMLVWNIATTWWVWNASEGGAVAAIFVNSLLMTIPWMLFRFSKQKLGEHIGYISLVLYWLSFEYIHLNWELSWPWLTLGNAFATHPQWVRWYAYTGTSGGSLWVWLVNLLVFFILKNYRTGNPFFTKQNVGKAFVTSLLLIMPMAYSWVVDGGSKSITNPQALASNIVVVQPNIDPYTEKYNTDPALQIAKILALSESKIDSNTKMVVWPETAVPVQVWENSILSNAYLQPVFQFIKKHPNILLVTGIESYLDYGKNKPNKFGMHFNQATNTYYEAFNTAMAMDGSESIQLYHKAKLVPGVETLPSWLGFMGKMFEEFGGTSGTYGSSKEPMVFSFKNNVYQPAPVICYESIYGEYVTGYLQKGANIITIITNDGWWGNTPGYMQHQSYARLRAIETGCWIARSANTGISCFISPKGQVINPQPWAVSSAIKWEVPVSTKKTFYVLQGDWISRMAWVIAALVLLCSFTTKWWKNKPLMA